MKKVILFLIVMYFYTASQAQYPTLLWTNKIQAITQSNPYCNIREIVVDAEGSVYAAGSFTDSLRLDKNPPFTTVQGNESAESAFFAKYDKDGILLWHRVIKGGYLIATDISLDKFNNVYIAGQAVTGAAIDFDPGTNVANLQFDGNDFYFAKYDANGNYVWAKAINVGNGNNSFENKMHTIYVDSSMNIYLAGQFQNTLDIDPDASTVTLANPGGSNCNCTVGFYAKYNNSGTLLWGRADTRNAAIRDLHVHDATGRIALAGERSTNFGTPFRLVSATGTGIDSLTGGRIISTCARFDAAGNVYYSGYFSSSNNDFDWGNGATYLSSQATYENVGFIAKYSSSLQFQWVRAYSPTNDTSYRAAYYEVNIAPDGNPLLSFSESNGNNVIKGFYKVNAVNGNEIWSPSAFNIWVGATLSSNAITSPLDGSFIFSCDVGFNGSGSTGNFDFNPDPQLTANLSGTGYWSAFVKYGDCISAPSQPGAITGNTNLCGTGMQIYSVVPVAGATRYNWVLPNGWTGSSDSAEVTVQPSPTSGVISVTAENFCGVSTARTLNVTYNSAPAVSITASNLTVCSGEQVTLSGIGATSYSWSNGVTDGVAFTPSSTTTYYVTGTTGACTDTASVTIQVKDPTSSLQNQSICSGQSYVFGGNTLTVAGTYYDTLSNAAGCDSVVTLVLTVLQNDNTSISAAICSGETYQFSGTTLTTAGTYYDTVTNASGCYAITTLTLAVNQPTGSSINASICPGQSYPFNGNLLIAPGVYYDTLQNVAGCDSIVTLTLTYRQPTSSALAAAICPGQSYFFNGVNRTVAGIYRDTLVNAAGCDSVITLTLSVKQSTSSVSSIVICQGDSHFFNGVNITTQGVYHDTLVNAAGCDSILTLNLTVTPSQYTSLQASICAGSSYTFGNRQLTQSGTYTDTLTAFNTCDSIVTLELQVDSILTSTVNASVCQGSSYSFNGQQLTTAGTYYDTLTATTGCDSVVTLALQVNNLPVLSVSPLFTRLCQGDSVQLTASGNGNFVWSDGSTGSVVTVLPEQTTAYNVTMTDGNNCTASQSVQIEVNAGPAIPVIQQQGDTLLAGTTDSCAWYLEDSLITGATQNILVITQNGSYAVEVTDSNGCSRRSQAFMVMSLGTNNISSSLSWSLYPNPAEEYVQVNCSGCNNGFTAEVYNILGNIIGTFSVAGSGSELDIRAWAPGTYFIKIQSGTHSILARFIKKQNANFR
jgi:hypothetical protein